METQRLSLRQMINRDGSEARQTQKSRRTRMRRWLLPIAIGSLLLAGTANADVDVFITYDKDKFINVFETIDIDKIVNIQVTVNSLPERAAEAEALINQTNYRNEACENCAEKRDIIDASLNFNSGVVDVNQAAGNMNNQGNAVSISVDTRIIPPSNGGGEAPKTGDSYAQAQAAADQRNGADRGENGDTNGLSLSDEGNVVDATNLIEKSASISGSLTGNSGVVHANQSAGNMNNQANNLAMAVGFGDGGVAIAESDLGQINAYNIVNESGQEGGEAGDGFVNKFVNISDSVNQNSGVVGVNQAAGNMANQANVVSFAVVIDGGNGATPPATGSGL